MRKTVFYAVLVLLVGGYTLLHSTRRRGAAGADPWPSGVAMTCVVPWSAGGAADLMARHLINYWEQELGTEIAVVNKPGNATLDGTEYFFAQPGDGSTIFIGTQMYASSASLRPDAGFTMDDFAIINLQQFDPVTVTVRTDSPYHTFQDLVNDIRARPGQVKCGLIPGGAQHLAATELKERLGLEWEDVLFDSGNTYRTALLGGAVDFIFSSANGDRSIQGSGYVLAVADDKRSRMWPGSPTFNEVLNASGFPKLGSARFVATRNTVRKKHPERFALLAATYKKAFENPEYAAFRESVGESEVSSHLGPEESARVNEALHLLLELHAPALHQ